MLVWLPLEPLEQRYTKLWAMQFPRQFVKDGVDFITISGEPLTDHVEVGSVLDAYSTSHWKATQLANLVKAMRLGAVKSTDTLLFADLWFPGIETLRYISCLGGVRPRITGILHAGTWDSNDFTYNSGMRPWAHGIEKAWFEIFDLVFVGTRYHKELILKSHSVDKFKIKVTGLPFYPSDITAGRQGIEKDDRLVVFPHRLDPEKRPEDFDSVVDGLDCNEVKTATDMGKSGYTKDKYYDTLARASIAISTARQETFGYAMLEALAFGCVPLVPDDLSYKEMYDSEFRYKNLFELRNKLERLLDNSHCLEICRLKSRANLRTNEAIYSAAISKMLEWTL